uniref:Putative ionotropic receptor ligand binding domain-containing protein n=1 Tax=Stomoxys calcitrans TaxID=35570 RepID=A0A1I8PLN5_STOCA
MNTLAEATFDNIYADYNISLILSVLWVIKHEFGHYNSTPLTIGQRAKNSKNFRLQQDLIDEIFKRVKQWNSETVFLMEGQTYSNGTEDIYAYSHGNREKSIWFLDGLEAYDSFSGVLHNSDMHFRRYGYFLLVYTGMERNHLKIIQEMFNRLFDAYVINVIVVTLIDKYPLVYTYFPFSSNSCYVWQPEIIASFKGTESKPIFFKGEKLFPNKVENMHSCNLAVVTWTFMPYMKVVKDAKSGKFLFLSGIEGCLLMLLSQHMNFSITIKEPKSLDRGDVYPNGSATGAAGMILRKEANITMISFLYHPYRANVLSASVSYINIPYFLAVSPGRSLTSFERLIKPFHYMVWTCFSTSFAIAVIFILYIRLLGQTKFMNFVFGPFNRTPLTNLVIILLGGMNHSRGALRNFARYLLALWLLYTMVLRVAYSGQLFRILKDASHHQSMKNLGEVIAKNCTIYAYPIVTNVIQISYPEAKTAHLDINNRANSIFERISQPKEGDNIVLYLLEYSLRYYNQKNPNRRVVIIRQPLIMGQIVFYMPRYSYLQPQLNNLIIRVLESGIIKRIESMLFYVDWKSKGHQVAPSQLTMPLLRGVFFVYVFCLGISFAIFLLELRSQNSERLRKLIDFFNM